VRIENVVNTMASQQHGLVSRSQLLAAGVRPGRIDRLVRSGWLRPVHRGIYHVGPVVPLHMAEMATVLACGAGAAISHQSAAGLWQLLPREPRRPIDVTIECAHLRGQRPGMRAHRTRVLPPDEVAHVDSVRVTTVARTLLDLAERLGLRELERLIGAAYRLEQTDEAALRALAARHAHRRGVRLLNAFLGTGAEPAFTRSHAEALLLSVIRQAGLPEPRVNSRVRGFEVDFHWRPERLVVEVDGFAHHSSARAFQRDRARDAALIAAGLRVMRVTWQQLESNPSRMLATRRRPAVRPLKMQPPRNVPSSAR
jgi:very-short-patch-repair endonuclease/predicted transcriptional regulator of viral defense system